MAVWIHFSAPFEEGRMTQTRPWSVKGIDQRAREAAREAAGAEGMTLGEYLNKLLLAADRDEPNEIARAYTAPQPKPNAATSTLDKLARRIEATEARSTLAITGMDQTVLGLVARLENTEQTSVSIAGHVEGLIDELRGTHESLQSKVDHLEKSDSSKKNVEALQALEQALGKLAAHVYDENEMAQGEALAIKGRVEAGFSEVTERVETMEAKVEQTLSGAASRVERAVEQAELRAEGTARHLSDRMSHLEANVSERLSGLDTNDTRLSAVESDVSGAIVSMESTLLRVQERLNRAETTTDAALQSLEATFVHLDERVEAVASAADPDQATRLREEFEARFDDLTASIQVTVETARKELAEEIARAASEVDSEAITDLKEEMASVQTRMTDVENLSDIASAETVREQIDLMSENVSEKIETLAEHVDARITHSEQSSAKAIEQVGEQVVTVTTRLQARQDEAIRLLHQEMDETHKRSDARLSDALTNVSKRLETMQERNTSSLSPIQKAIATLATRLESVEEFNAPPFASQLASHASVDDLTPSTHTDFAPLDDDDDIEIESIDETEDFDAIAAIDPFENTGTIADPVKGEDIFSDVFGALEANTFPAEIAADENDEDDDDVFVSLSEEASTPHDDDLDLDAVVENDEEIDLPGTDWEVRPEAEDRYKEDFEAISAAAAAAITAEDIPESSYRPETPAAEVTQPVDVSHTDTHHFDDELAESVYESRDSDVFDSGLDEEDSANPRSEPLFDGAQLMETAETDAATSDYIARARKAAIAAADTGAGTTKANASDKNKRKGGGGGAGSGGSKFSGSKGSLFAAASAVVITGAAVGGYWTLRGKQAAPVQTVSIDTYQDPEAVIDAPAPNDTVTVADASTELTEDVAFVDTSTQIDAEEGDLFDTGNVAEDTPLEIEVAESSSDDGLMPAASEMSIETAEVAPTEKAVSIATYPPLPEFITIEAAANSGNRIAQYQLGQANINDGDYKEGASLIRKSAQKGLPVAQYSLAKLHEKGIGLPKDLNSAREWTEKAANSGNIKAMHDLAVYMAEGEGGEQSYAGAVEWFRKGAEFGVVDSQYNLGVLYERGLGISPNLTEALFWFQIAASNNDAGAPSKVQELSARVSTEAAMQTSSRAKAWRPARANAISNGRFGAQPWNTGNPLQVQAIQVALTALGYDVGAPDGLLGPTTIQALTAYQEDNGLIANGKIQADLIDHLNEGATGNTRG
jgi:localization factor PodJL